MIKYMGKYSIRGSADFDNRLDIDFKKVVKSVISMPEANTFVAIALMGGYGRGEGTPFQREGIEEPYNDYDLVVIGEKMSLFKKRKIQQKLQLVEHSLSSELNIPVDLAFQSLSSLSRAEPSLMNYELKFGHSILWGARDVLDIIPCRSICDVPLSEGTRLLLNRGALLLQLNENNLLKYLWKAILALGDCILLIHHVYDISYETKRKTIQDFHHVDGIPHIVWIIDHYQEAVSFKHSGNLHMLRDWNCPKFIDDVKRRFCEFFLWYEGRRLNQQFTNTDQYRQTLEETFWSWKGLALEWLLLGFQSVQPNWKWAAIHPRHRLYAALPDLIMEKQKPILDKLLYSHLNQSLLERFEQLRKRLA